MCEKQKKERAMKIKLRGDFFFGVLLFFFLPAKNKREEKEVECK